jgi:hypothetical protein
MNTNHLLNLRDEALAATREITDPAARLHRLLDVARGDEALLDEAADLARSFEAPEQRAAGLLRVHDTALRTLTFTDDD